MNVATIITMSDALNRNRVRSEPVNYYRSKMILRIQEIGEFLAEFNVEADVVETWKSQIGFIRKTYRLDEGSLKILVSMKLKGKAQTWFQSNVSHLQLCMTELLDKMVGTYNQRFSMLTLQKYFEERTWRANEIFADYLYEKETLINKTTISETEVLEYTIDGISDVRVGSQAKMHRFKTRNNLL